jgi:hypothetical protein
VTVFLQHTQVCGPPIDPAAHIVSPVSADVEPAFPVADLNTGETHFTVR